jgi:SAM-dependent methyltransferase
MLRALINAPRRAYASVRRAIGNILFERPAGIETAAIVRLQELGLAAPDRENYHPTPWLALKRVLRQDEVTDQDVFIDFGCGKGRILYQAAMYPFRRVIGVEISPDLAQIARDNIQRSLPKLRCRDVEVVTADVVNYEVPDDVTLVYFFDPFHGEVFAALLDRIIASLRRRPRELTIIYLDPFEEQALLDAGAKLVKATSGMRPTKAWAQENSIRMYKLGVAAHARSAPPTVTSNV